jgi:nitrogen fixation NifU-like protein
MQLESMYQDIILDHYRNPHGKGLRAPYSAEVHHVNPTCGDELTLRVDLGEGPDPTLRDISYDGAGCSISQASVSVLAELATGERLSQLRAQHEAFLELMHGRGSVTPDEDVLGDAVAFAGVAQYPARVKCALLGWMALQDAIAQSLAAPVNDEGDGS